MEFFGKNDRDRCCKYCEITENDISTLSTNQKVFTKRFYSRGKTMEVDQRDAFKGYSLNNIDLVCYWCNNAKTDEFTEVEFIPLGKAFKELWHSRLDTLKLKKVA